MIQKLSHIGPVGRRPCACLPRFHEANFTEPAHRGKGGLGGKLTLFYVPRSTAKTTVQKAETSDILYWRTTQENRLI